MNLIKYTKKYNKVNYTQQLVDELQPHYYQYKNIQNYCKKLLITYLLLYCN